MLDSCAPANTSLLTVAEALQRIKATIQPITESESILLPQALGRITAAPVFAPINLPFERNSAMDGYAFHSEDIPTSQPFTLHCIGTSWAGRAFEGNLQQGQCVRIFTGAVIPEGADSVIMQEEVTVDGNNIILPTDTKPYQHVRAVGEDVQQGSCLLEVGKKLTVSEVSLLAACGIGNLTVKRRIKIAYFSTGDELVPLEQPLTSGKIYDSNRYTLQELLSDVNVEATNLGIIGDDKQILQEKLLAAVDDYDVLITTGGASVGDADYVSEILAQCGQVNFWKIALKPGKPLAFGRIGKAYFFGLPGNPVSVMATFQHLVAPALERLSGQAAHKALTLQATCTSPLKKAQGRLEYQRGILSQDAEGGFWVASSGGQGSHMLASLSKANCYIVLPLECAGVKIGEQVLVEPFSLQLPE